MPAADMAPIVLRRLGFQQVGAWPSSALLSSTDMHNDDDGVVGRWL